MHIGLVQFRFHRQIEVEVGAVGKSFECVAGALDCGGESGWLLGSIGSMRAKMEGCPEADVDASGRVVEEEEGMNSGARGSGIPARPKMLIPFEAGYGGGG